MRIGGNKVNIMSMYNAVRFVFSCAIVCEKKESGGHSIVRLIALSDELYKRDYSQEKEGGKRRREREREERKTLTYLTMTYFQGYAQGCSRHSYAVNAILE